jgi:hypothetical protein
MVLFSVLFFCKNQALLFENRNVPKTVEEYVVKYKNGIPNDTSLKSKSIFDAKGILLEMVTFFEGKVDQKYVYMNGDSIYPDKYISKSDHVIYVLRDKKNERQYYNGRLVNDAYYDRNSNIIKVLNYALKPVTPIGTTELFLYQYSNNRIKYETDVWNKDTLRQIEYKYNKDSLLVEKYYLRNSCCDGNQPIPDDKIVYRYDNNKNLIKEIRIIDRNIARPYKKKPSDYFFTAIITSFIYGKQNRIVGKKIYVPLFNEKQNLNIDNITSRILSEEYIYKYI